MASARRTLVLALALLASLVPIIGAAPALAATPVFINEIHYDNASTDTGEAIEVAGPAGTDLTGWELVLYNGNDNAEYNTTGLSGTIPDDGGGFGTVVQTYASNGIQNGSPDGMALVNAGVVVQFLSYEGSFTASGGPADGMTSTDIGVSEPGNTPVGQSLQLAGSGSMYEDFSWQAPSASTFNAFNTGQTFGVPLPNVFVNELHYDTTGGDVGEAIEVAGDAGTDLSGFELVLYNGNNGLVYNTVALAGVLTDQGAGLGTAFVAIAGIQNGSPDGIALVSGSDVIQFLSYEGTFTANDGPATGMISTDIGVSESGAPVGTSLQLGGAGTVYEDFTWQDSLPNTFGNPNANQVFGDEPPPPTGSDTLVVNEIDYDQSGTDTAEYLELYNVSDAAIDLDGWTVELVNQAGTVYNTVDLPAVSLPAGGFYVVCGNPANVANCDLDVLPLTNAIQNGPSDAVAVSNDGVLVDTVSYEGDAPDPYTEGSGTGLLDTPSGFVGISRFGDGEDTDRNNVDLLSSVCSTPGEPNSDATTLCDPPVEVKIHEVQGPGDASPIEGSRVIVEGVVVGDEETFDRLAGFFVQEEDYDVDDDPMTSEGVFVFNFSNDDVELGDVVRVEGTVEERFDNTQLTDFVEVEVLEVKPRVATPATIKFPLDDPTDFEWVEGMAVAFPQKLVVTEYFNYDRFGEIVIGLPAPGTDRPMQPTAVFAPGSPEGIKLAAFNARSRIMIDDGQTSQNPEFNVHPVFRNEFGLDNAFRGGDVVTGIGGPMYYSFDNYKVIANTYDDFHQTVRDDNPPYVRGRLEVATLNALNYFLTLDNGVDDICGADQNLECRGADTEEEFLRQRSKLLQALARLDADVVGLVELENTPGVSPLADIVDGLNDMVGKKTYDYVDTGVVGGDAIKVGFIYKRKVVKPYKKPAILDTDAFVDPNNTGSPKNRAALAVTFNEKGSGQRFSVVLNHFKSKGSGCGGGDDDEYAGSCNLTRTLAAQELTEWIDTDPTKSKDKDWMILGDLNSYDKEDPIVALQKDGYRDLIAKYNGEYAYTYVFSGQWGYLDYAMANKALARQVRSTKIWNLNSDEPDIFDYDTSFKSASQIAMFEGDLPYRSSDHDAVIVGLDLRRSHRWWWSWWPRWH